MRISESQLRRIVSQEVKRKGLMSEANPPAATSASGTPGKAPLPANYPKLDKTRAVDANGYISWEDADFRYKVKPMGGPGQDLVYTTKRGNKNQAIQVFREKDQKSYDAIVAQAGQQQNKVTNASNNPELPGCQLESLRAPLTNSLKSFVKSTAAVSFYVQLLVYQNLPFTGQDLVDAGNRISNFGDSPIVDLSSLIAAGIDGYVGPLNEIVGALLVFYGNVMIGVRDAQTKFLTGGPGIRCSWRALASAVGAAYSNAFAQSKAALASGFNSIQRYISYITPQMISALLAGSPPAQFAATLHAALAGGMVFLQTLVAQTPVAIMQAGSTATQTASQSNPGPTNESWARKSLDALALEICTIAYTKKLINENIRPVNRGLVLV